MAYRSKKLFLILLSALLVQPCLALDEPPGTKPELNVDEYLERLKLDDEKALSQTEKLRRSGRNLLNELNPEMQSGGYTKIYNVHELKAAAQPSKLTVIQPTEQQRELIESAKKIASNNPTLALLLIEKGQVLFQTYNAPATERTPILSHSMSKSLTAYTIGNMHCQGLIGSLDEPAQIYASWLTGSVYGEATVRHLLKMSSGAGETIANGEKRVGATPRISQRTYTVRRYLRDFSEREVGPFGPTRSGSRFVYSNLDTAALGLIAEANGGLAYNFDRFIWSQIGAESPGFWTLDREKIALSYAGFHATGRDWARLAIFSVRQLKSGSSCIKDFMERATTPQISNFGSCCKTFKSYGYQTWVGDFGPRRSYWWVGYGGQRIGIDPETERIIIVLSWAEDYMDQVYDLFARWQRY